VDNFVDYLRPMWKRRARHYSSLDTQRFFSLIIYLNFNAIKNKALPPPRRKRRREGWG
jgi:hypothetical protein